MTLPLPWLLKERALERIPSNVQGQTSQKARETSSA